MSKVNPQPYPCANCKLLENKIKEVRATLAQCRQQFTQLGCFNYDPNDPFQPLPNSCRTLRVQIDDLDVQLGGLLEQFRSHVEIVHPNAGQQTP
jgi:hypothetical protein